LHCIGLSVNDEASQVSFVFQLPKIAAEHTVSLRDILGGAKGPKAPSVSTRIELALQIAQSIHYFHTAGWMHKNIRSENIRFFAERSSSFTEGAESLLTEPMITGFTFARLDAPGEITDKPSAEPARDIYRHASTLNGVAESYQPFMDLYSLGTILLEIAEWRPLSTLLREVVDLKQTGIVPLTQLARINQWLYRAASEGQNTVKVDFRMGKRYARAARLCLGVESVNDAIVKGVSKVGAQNRNTVSVLEAVLGELRGCII
jgi:serine/threonine protein kinase